MLNFRKILIVLALSWGVLGCDSLMNEGDSNIQQEDEYIQLAKRYKQEYLSKMRSAKASAQLSKKELKKIAERYNFNAEKIESYRKEILQIAKSYGLDTKDITLEKYFFIHPYSGKILGKDFYNRAFAYAKYLEEQFAPMFKKAEKANKRISALTKKYDALILKAEDPLKRRKLREEYRRKLKKITLDVNSTNKLNFKDEVITTKSKNLSSICPPFDWGCESTFSLNEEVLGCRGYVTVDVDYSQSLNFNYFGCGACDAVEYRDSGFSHGNCDDNRALAFAHYNVYADYVTWEQKLGSGSVRHRFYCSEC